jgi:hypothetical protein
MKLRLFHFSVTSMALIAGNAIYELVLTTGSFANFAHTSWMQVTALGIAAMFWPIHKPTEAEWVDSNHK